MTSSPPSSGSAKKVAGLTSSSMLEAERKHSEAALTKMKDFLRGYSPQGDKIEKDIIQGRFTISFSEPLAEFTSPYANAYAVNETLEPEKHFFAQLCEAGKVQIGMKLSSSSGFEADCAVLPSCSDSEKLSYDGSKFVL